MAVLNAVRLTLFTLIALFSIIASSLLAYLTSITDSAGFYYSSFALGIAAGILSILAIVTTVVVDIYRRAAVTSLVWYELAWTGLTWILWLSTAAGITSLDLFSSCTFVNATVQANCREYLVALVFSWINWVLMFSWFSSLLAVSVIVAARGEPGNVWQTPVNEHLISCHRRGASGSSRSPTSTIYPTFAPWDRKRGAYARGADVVATDSYTYTPQWNNIN